MPDTTDHFMFLLFQLSQILFLIISKALYRGKTRQCKAAHPLIFFYQFIYLKIYYFLKLTIEK
ncbi:MAG: hypothetical protein CVU39_08060 [Chloroflexi bacterium HGW-Chloroflexi-10]|nr:MAG: hypothetical protein CVU39_08060 [Chloroflexi bacterium HGW-Chloroflexi-10]